MIGQVTIDYTGVSGLGPYTLAVYATTDEADANLRVSVDGSTAISMLPCVIRAGSVA